MTVKLTMRPLRLAGPGDPLEKSLKLAGGPLTFAAVETVVRAPSRPPVRRNLTPGEIPGWIEALHLVPQAEALLERLTAPRADFASLSLDRPRIMAVINVTPDSFSDGGERLDVDRAVAEGLALKAAGADILDVGGESTRPGAEPVGLEEELRRILPVVEGLAAAGAVVSIDTRHAAVMSGALAAGARIVNDVTALAGDPRSLALVADSGAPVVLMHMQGDPRSMQKDPSYKDVVLDIYDYLAARVEACVAAGIAPDRIAVDPGIGFGKTLEHNLQILDQVAIYHGLGTAVLLGVSRKAFIGRLSHDEPPKERVPGSLAAALAGAARGVQIIRVHDVAETYQALKVWRAVTMAPESLV
jgi:dihydropteroate synthase